MKHLAIITISIAIIIICVSICKTTVINTQSNNDAQRYQDSVYFEAIKVKHGRN